MHLVCREEIFCREQAYQSLSLVGGGGGGGGCEFSTIPPFGAPLHFDWTKLAHVQLGYHLGLQYKTIIASLWYLATEEMW